MKPEKVVIEKEKTGWFVHVAHLGGFLVVAALVYAGGYYSITWANSALASYYNAPFTQEIQQLNTTMYGCPKEYRPTIAQMNQMFVGFNAQGQEIGEDADNNTAYFDSSTHSMYECDNGYSQGFSDGVQSIINQLASSTNQ